jgi:hypothetical protein
MSTTWATKLASDDGHELRLSVQIQGIPHVFHGDGDGFPSLLLPSGATALGIVTSIDQSETRLNLARRRVEGGSLTVRLQDDESGTLAALFAPRQYRKAFVTSSVTTTGELTVSSVGAFPSAGTVYVEGETVKYTSKVGTTLTGCTRGAFSSEAQQHLGTATDGAAVFSVPPSWEGRRVYLTGYFKPQDVSANGAVAAASALSTQLGTFRLQGPPKHLGDDTWELSCGDLIEEFGTKKIGGGLFEVQLDEVTQELSTDMQLVVGEGVNFNQFVVGAIATHIVVKDGDDVVCTRLVSQSGTDTITYAEPIAALADLRVQSVRHIAMPMGPLSYVALYVIASRLGDGTNGTYDVLPGYAPANFGEGEWRMGGGVLESEIDTDSFLAFTRGNSWSYVIDDEVDLADFMFDWCLAAGAAWLVNRSGQLKVITLKEDGSASVMTVDDSVVADSAPLTMSYEEAAIYPRLRLECNYNPLTRDYDLVENLFDAALQRRYPNREDSLEIKSKGINIDRSPGVDDANASATLGRPAVSARTAEDALREIQASEGRGRAYVQAVCNLRILKAQLGDVVTLDALTVPDAEGNTTLSAHPARVVAMRPRYDDAEVDVTFQLLDKLWRVAPACTIASRAGAVLTLNTSDIGIPNATPGRMFANTGVFVWDVSGATKHTANVIAHTDTTITLDAAPAFANEANVDFVKIDSQTNGSGAASQDGYTDDEWLYMMPDDENDGTPIEITRWR